MEKLNYQGLSDEQVKISRAENGGNVLPAPVRVAWYIQYLRKFRDPVIRILMIAAVLSCLIGDWVEGGGILAAILLATFIAFLNLLQWTYGVDLLTGGKGKLSFRKVMTAPFMIAILIGLFFYFSGIAMPHILLQCVNFLSGCNTPIAMFTIGIYLAQTNVAAMFKKKALYGVSAVRLVLIPLITLVLLSLLPGEYMELKMAILIAAACPVGSNVAVYAHLHDRDYPYAVETVVISTILSLITIPLLVALAQMVW